MSDLTPLLKQSMVEYALVSRILDLLADHLDNPEPQLLVESLDRLNEAQERAKHTDAQVDALLHANPLEPADRHLLEQRMNMLARILEKNRLLFTRSNGMLAVTAAELSHLRGGRAALGGYRTGSRHSGHVVNHSY